MDKKTTKAELEALLQEQEEQLKLMDKLLITKEERNMQSRIDLLDEQAKKRPLLDANLWLGLKIGLTVASVVTAILGLLILMFIL